MKLREALESISQQRPQETERTRYLLACSSTPTHLRTFLHAYLLGQRPGCAVDIETSLYGDLLGGLERYQPQGYTAAAIICEWYDLDPRLGFRRLGGWGPSLFDDIAGGVRKNLGRLQLSVERICDVIPVVVVLPTLPLPPLGTPIPAQASSFESNLWRAIWEFGSWCSSHAEVRLLSPSELDRCSPPSERFDIGGELSHGMPYRLAHASKLAELLSRLLAPSVCLKGLITDLDDTLWAGILGDVGPSGVRFALETGGQIHGLYQQFLQSLAERGILIAIASKNEAELAEKALSRTDLLVRRQSFFPVEIHWEAKSESVRRILKAWNVGAEAVAFIDDSPLEAAEVQMHFPSIRTLSFPAEHPDRLIEFFNILRDWFGKPTIHSEDRIRSRSLQTNLSMGMAAESPASMDDFLAGIDGRLSFQLSQDRTDVRAFELVNKTNQFNLNGRRISEASWRETLSQHESFLLTVAYSDKFGPLGKIAAVVGRSHDREAIVSTWVMSCRAFSRRIEHATLRYLFERLGVDRLSFDFGTTERNAVLREFFAEMKIAGSPASISRTEFEGRCPIVPHSLEDATVHV